MRVGLIRYRCGGNTRREHADRWPLIVPMYGRQQIRLLPLITGAVMGSEGKVITRVGSGLEKAVAKIGERDKRSER